MIHLWLRNLFSSWQSFFALKKLEENALVFYAESNADWAHIGSVLNHLLENLQQPVTCVTSDPEDSILKRVHPKLQTFFIGSGTARTLFFQGLKAKAMVMTLTDLNVYFLRRSVNPVHYFYIFHALVSTHAAYRENAFDGYDTIFCVGPYHKQEIEFKEKISQLRPKNLLDGGYCRLDQLIAEVSGIEQKLPSSENPTVLVSPTWGPSSMVENCLEDVIKILTSNQINTILRLHPMTLRHFPDLPEKLEKEFGQSGFFSFDRKLQAIDSLTKADLMIADHGGSAIEFALGLEKPVISIATPAKIHNPQRDRIELPLFEDLVRPIAGAVVKPDQLNQLPKLIDSMFHESASWREKLAEVRRQNIFNVGQSAKVMAEHIYDFVASTQKGN